MPKMMREFKNTLRVGCWSGRPHAAQKRSQGQVRTHTPPHQTTPNHTTPNHTKPHHRQGTRQRRRRGEKGHSTSTSCRPLRPSIVSRHARAWFGPATRPRHCPELLPRASLAEPSRPAWATTAEPRRCARRRPWVVRAASFAPALRVGPLDDHLADRRRHEWATGDGQSKRRGWAQSRLVSRQQKFSLTSHLSQQSRAFPACSAATRPSDGWWADWNHPPVTGSSMARSVGGALIPSPAMDSLTKGRRRAVHATH